MGTSRSLAIEGSERDAPTTFLALERQNALSEAQGRELRALTDYNKAISDLQRVMGTTLTTRMLS